MIGESTCLGRGGIHYDLFIKVGKRLSVTLSSACGVPSALQSPNGVPISHTAGTTIHLLSTAGFPRELRRLLFFFILSTYNLLKRSIFWSCSTDSFRKTIVQ